MIVRSVTISYDVDETTSVGRTSDGRYVRFSEQTGDDRAEVEPVDVVSVYLREGGRIPDAFVEARAKAQELL